MFKKLSNILFPSHCQLCKKNGEVICLGCAQKLQKHRHICPVCHRYSPNFQVCTICKNKVFYDGLYINYNYQGIIKKLILNLKYFHLYNISKGLSKLINIDFIDNVDKEKIVVTYVPNHRIRKYFIKGYNQSEIIARNFAQHNGLSFLQTTKKIKYTKSQTQLKRNDRLENLKGSFKICSNLKLKGDETIIIIDDVTTTGSTINEIAQTIKKAFPKTKIWGIVLARNNN